MAEDQNLASFEGITRIFPLPGVVLFPHVVLPLHIFEPRYRRMMEDALAQDGLVTIVQTRVADDWQGLGEPGIETVGCLGKIIAHERLEDGRYNLLLLGIRRVEIVRELEVDTLYRQVEVELIDEIAPTEPEEPVRTELVRLFRETLVQHGELDRDLDRLLGTELDLAIVTDLVSHAMGFPPAVKQRLLAEPLVERRAGFLLEMLREINPAGTPGRRYPYPPTISLN